MRVHVIKSQIPLLNYLFKFEYCARDDVSKWLESRKLSGYSKLFWEHCIDGSILLELDERDLFEDLFIDNSESRLAIMQNIACLQFYVMYGHEYPLASRSA